jgi:transposase
LPDQHTKSNTEEIALNAGIMVPLDLPEFRVLEQHCSVDGTISIQVIAKTSTMTCPHCQGECGKIHDCRIRAKRDITLRGYSVRLLVQKRRFACSRCAKTCTEPDEACGRRRRTTSRLRASIGKQVASRSVAHVSHEEEVGPRFARECFREQVAPQMERRGLSLDGQGPLPTPRYLGIDEYAIQKGHRYATLLCDLEKRCPLETCRGRTQEEVIKLLARLDHPERVEAISLDMSGSFAPAIRQVLPQAILVIDHFHVIQHVMKAFRKVVTGCAKQGKGQILLHHKQSLFLKPLEKLTEEQKQERARIASHLPGLETAWRIKEDLRQWYAEATAQTAEERLDQWMARVRQSGPEDLRKTLAAFVNWKPEILAFFRFLPTRISNGYVRSAKIIARRRSCAKDMATAISATCVCES